MTADGRLRRAADRLESTHHRDLACERNIMTAALLRAVADEHEHLRFVVKVMDDGRRSLVQSDTWVAANALAEAILGGGAR